MNSFSSVRWFAKSIEDINRRHRRTTARGVALNFEYPDPARPRPFLHPLELRIPPLALAVLAGGFAWLGARTFPALSRTPPARAWLAAALGLLGLACCGLGVAAFRRARTTVNPLAPNTATTLVVSGIYRITRNPMYLGFLFLLLSELAWLANPVALLPAPAFVLWLNRFQIVPEERALRDAFGVEFVDYSALVPRWL